MPRMSPHQARSRFAAARVARLATVDDAGRPHLVPVVFATDGADGIVTAVDHKPKTTARLKRLHNIEVSPAVCLLADAYDEDWDRLWWARADGGARILAPHGPGAPAADPRREHEEHAEHEKRAEYQEYEQYEERAEYEAAVAALRRKYPQYARTPPRGPVIAVTVHRWTGWQAAPADPAGPPG
ncbi:TIGR03668 family PPOX class F420-dependent oxidoreductase [Streptomyces sp. NPDC003374]